MTIPSLDANDKVVVVTGGSKGLGTGHGAGVRRSGCRCRRRQPQARILASEVAAEIRASGRKALAVRCHVGDWNDCAALVDTTVAAFGRIDVLVNNAGIAPVPPSLLEVSAELFDKTIAVNLKGPLRLTALVAEHMTAGGSIINISSKASLHPTAFTVVYAAAKAGLNALTKAAANEFGPKGYPCQCHRVRYLSHGQSPRLASNPGAAGADGRPRSPGPDRLRRGDRRHRALSGQ